MSVDPALGIAVTTVRPDECAAFVAAVLDQPARPGCLSVAHQGTPEASAALERRLTDLAGEREYDGLVVRHDPRRGISRGRNVAVRGLPESVTWVWTPNDTSRPPEDWVGAWRQHVVSLDDAVGAVALDYRVGGRLRRRVSDVPALTGWSLWRAIEPALLWRRQAVLGLGGFDERIGTGAQSWAQSGDGTDLLARLERAGYTVSTLPIAVDGRAQRLDASRRDVRRKEFYYGVGFGCVARRHFRRARSLAAVAGPLVKLVTGGSVEGERLGVRLSLTAVAGRGVGLLLGERCLRLRLRGTHWA